MASEKIDRFVLKGAEIVGKASARMAGTGIGFALGGPAGALVGALAGAASSPVLELPLVHMTTEFAQRMLGHRQARRAAAGLILFADAVRRQEEEGGRLREDDFMQADDADRSGVEELIEQSVQAAIASIEEQRLPFLANLYASICFDESVSRASVASLAAITTSLTWRGMCLMKVIADGKLYGAGSRPIGTFEDWPELEHLVAMEANTLVSDGLLVLKKEEADYYDANLGYQDIEPSMLKLSAIGQGLYSRMRLADLDATDPVLLETEAALGRIATRAAGNVVLDSGAF